MFCHLAELHLLLVASTCWWCVALAASRRASSHDASTTRTRHRATPAYTLAWRHEVGGGGGEGGRLRTYEDDHHTTDYRGYHNVDRDYHDYNEVPLARVAASSHRRRYQRRRTHHRRRKQPRHRFYSGEYARGGRGGGYSRKRVAPRREVPRHHLEMPGLYSIAAAEYHERVYYGRGYSLDELPPSIYDTQGHGIPQRHGRMRGPMSESPVEYYPLPSASPHDIPVYFTPAIDLHRSPHTRSVGGDMSADNGRFWLPMAEGPVDADQYQVYHFFSP